MTKPAEVFQYNTSAGPSQWVNLSLAENIYKGRDKEPLTNYWNVTVFWNPSKIVEGLPTGTAILVQNADLEQEEYEDKEGKKKRAHKVRVNLGASALPFKRFTKEDKEAHLANTGGVVAPAPVTAPAPMTAPVTAPPAAPAPVTAPPAAPAPVTAPPAAPAPVTAPPTAPVTAPAPTPQQPAVDGEMLWAEAFDFGDSDESLF